MDDKLTIGLAMRPEPTCTKFDKYRGLFADRVISISENYGIASRSNPFKNLIIAADVLQINYSDVASVESCPGFGE